MKTFVLSILFFLVIAVSFGQTVPIGPLGTMPFDTTNVATATATLTNYQSVGLLTGTPTAAATYTTPTAVQFCAYFRSIVPPNLTNFAWHWWIKNTSGGANTITVAGGTGMTLVGTGTAAQNNMRHLVINLTNCTPGSEAGNIVSLETAAF